MHERTGRTSTYSFLPSIIALVSLLGCGASIDAGEASKRGVDAVESGLKMAELTDDFGDNHLDAAKWAVTADASTSAHELNQTLRLETGLGRGFVSVSSQSAYDLRNGAAFVKVIEPGQASPNHGLFFRASRDASNSVEFFLFDGTLFPRKTVKNVTSNACSGVAYDAAEMKFWRKRESAGRVYWDYSRDSATWTNFCNIKSPFALSAIRVQLLSGNWGTAPATAAVLDNLNVREEPTPTPPPTTTPPPTEPTPPASAGPVFYVSPSGNDANAGTSASSPWRTIEKVNATHFAAGSRILFEGGQSFSGNLTFGSDDSAEPTNPIFVGSYGTGRATLRSSNAGADGFSVVNLDGFVVDNLNIVGPGRTVSARNGLLFWADVAGATFEMVRIGNVQVSGFGDHGIFIGAGGSTKIRDVRIEHTVVNDNGKGGLMTWSPTPKVIEDVYVGHVTAYNNTGISGMSSPTGNGITIASVNGGIVERSIAYNNGALNTFSAGPVGIWTYDSNAVLIQHNESYSNKSAGGDGDGFDIDGGSTNCVLQYNYAHDNDGAGYLLAQYDGAPSFGNNVVRYNISQNDGRRHGYGGITVWGFSPTYRVVDSHIHNNVVFMSQAPDGVPAGLVFWDYFSGVTVRNNVFIVTPGLSVVDTQHAKVELNPANLLLQQNAYWASGGSLQVKWGGATYTSLTSWRTTGQEMYAGAPTGLDVNPQLTAPGSGATIGNADDLSSLASYRLLSTSPLRDAGLNLPASFGLNVGTHDFFGGAVPVGAYDIGAHEGS